ncbi:ParA family protein [Thermoproteus tenax]|uniref:ParA family protein n=1 Tax=Thermoproteus tenax TaxID=2271 RepID=UPI000AA7AB06|nr:ParA family protein [Thermoproteus tenax]
MITISFISASGGVGKTTFSILTAGAFAIKGRRVLLVDLDPSATATLWTLGDKKREAEEEGCDIKSLMKGLLDYKAGRSDRRTDVERCLYAHRVVKSDASFKVLPGGNLDDLTSEIFKTPRWEILLDELLSDVRDKFDYIIVDSPNWLYSYFGMVVHFAPFYVVLTRPAEPELRKTVDMLKRVRALLERHFNIKDSDRYMLAVINQIKAAVRSSDVKAVWESVRDALTKEFPGLTVLRNEAKDKYYGDAATEFYGFKLRDDLSIESYLSQGHPMVVVGRDKSVRSQFNAYFESLVSFIDSTSPYRVE